MATPVTRIPTIMRAHGWHNGARLMEIWLSRTAARYPHYGPPDDSTITVDRWALTFPRARAVFDTLVRERVWANAAARREIAKVLRSSRLLTPTPRRFGDVSRAAGVQDADYINQRVVVFGGFMDAFSELDDMAAALGSFAFRVTVAGTVAPVAGGAGYLVTLTDVGVYIRDSYDFEGNQSLGYWDASTNRVSMTNPFAGDAISNASFRAWRAATKLGGDFVVYSDVKRVAPGSPNSFVVL